MKKRCTWTKDHDLNIVYHDNEWGVPLHDDAKLFEFLILDAFQAGLSWLTMLKKRNNFRNSFDNFDYSKIANYSQKKLDELLKDKGIIRNKLKINAAVSNAKAFIKIQKEFGSFDKYIWKFTSNNTIVNCFKTFEEIPTETPESQAMSKDLKKRGFKFVGPTICYAFMQAAGMVNDHEPDCFRYDELMVK